MTGGGVTVGTGTSGSLSGLTTVADGSGSAVTAVLSGLFAILAGLLLHSAKHQLNFIILVFIGGLVYGACLEFFQAGFFGLGLL